MGERSDKRMGDIPTTPAKPSTIVIDGTINTTTLTQ
jgi:hypothetical protein